MKIGRVYSIAFAISMAVLLVFAWLLNNNIKSLSEKVFWEDHSQIIIEKLARLNISMTEIETSQRGFLLTNDSSLLDLLYSTRDKIPMLLDTLANLTRDNAEQQRNLRLLRDALVRRLQKAQEVINRSSYVSEAQIKLELIEGNRLMEDFRKKIAAVANEEQRLLRSRTQSKEFYERLTPTYFTSIFLVSTIIAVTTFLLLIREARGRQKTQALLEMRLQSLARVNAELQQIAHVTSHDLQEPLRKIRTFSDLLNLKFGPTLPADAKHMLNRVGKNANTIRELVADLSEFADLANQTEAKSANVDLNKIIIDNQKELAVVINEKQARFFVSTLPVIHGYEKQLSILFKEIITNSIKFSREGVTPEITITGNLITGDQVKKEWNFGDRNFHVISIYDNGIGFDNELSHKIFVLFQKLHGNDSPYRGKGIGLAVCQRIMSNHDGFITGTGEQGKGAKIQLFFPLS